MSRLHAKLNYRRWKWTRQRALHRDGYRCQGCGKSGKLQVHHKQGLAVGGNAYDLDNVVSLCGSCHISQHGKTPMNPRKRRRRRVRWEMRNEAEGAAGWQTLVKEL